MPFPVVAVEQVVVLVMQFGKCVCIYDILDDEETFGVELFNLVCRKYL